ncbi:Transcriptional activator [Drechslerella dactyloides]|uniref:Transcriptional activator n=1 Tax=Drechslerella dactyloides TaxID=74499 RepID=A0AAD6IYR7_DREDA|nr:Transcriptional activator [Drechslerella dactyloides]
MPGIIPMKLIKTGNSNQCSQCASVGFQCKTSDKLSRRAFPRGYTESLEERVRILENEATELKSLLDAKDEQLDVISRLHSYSPYSPTSLTSTSPKRPTPSKPVSEASGPSVAEESPSEDDTFSMPESSSLVHDGKSGEFYTGASSGRAFIEFSGNTFFTRKERIVKIFPNRSAAHAVKPPPRMISDLLVTAFFQEYHPLFPILHRPKFLSIYDNLINCEQDSPEYPREYHEIAQLFLVFSIASSQSETRNTAEHESFTRQWQYALEAIMLEPSLESLQCLVLAQLYCMSIGDDSRLNQYKSLAVGTALRLGLNQDQKKFGVSALQLEMRKRAFWCVYLLDAFSAAMLGLPTLIKDDEVSAEYPADIDDEYVSESGFLPTMPGDHTKISSALALFRGSRILAKVLSKIYSVQASKKQSYKELQRLEEDLDAWKANLAPHLRLEFVNGMPGTNIVHSRSPLLVFAYYYIRILIHRSTVGSDANSSAGSIHAVVESSNRMFQIVKLLEERKLGFSFCLNKNQTLLLCTFAILHGATDYAHDGVLAKDTQKLVVEILNTLQKNRYPLAKALNVIAASLFKLDRKSTTSKTSPSPSLPSPIREDVQQLRRAYSMSATRPQEKLKPRQIQTDAVSISGNMSPPPPSSITYHSNWSRTSLPPQNASPRSLHTASKSLSSPCPISPVTPGIDKTNGGNSDFYSWSLGSTSTTTDTPTSITRQVASGESEWEKMLALMDQNQGINIYGGGPTFESSVEVNNPLESPTESADRRDSNSARSIYEVLHPTAASVSSFSNFSDEELAIPIFDTDNTSGYYPDLMGGSIPVTGASLSLDNTWML